MCAIAGIITRVQLQPKWLKLMNEEAKHRGPDGEGYLLSTENLLAKRDWLKVKKSHIYSLGLAHRQLAITETLTKSFQPMSLNDDLFLVFNGEIYNHCHLREKLCRLGHQFNNKSDSEVVLHAYEQWGPSCVKYFNGMWALAIYDRNRDLLFLSRDRFGIKPLYFIAKKDLFCFGSEIKQLLALPFVERRLDEKRAFDFLFRALQDHSSFTLFKGIRQVEAGQNLTIDLNSGKINKEYYYRLDKKPSTKGFSFASLVDHSLALRLAKQPRMGLLLSGGIDSSVIAGLAARQGIILPAFTALYDFGPNELPYAEAVAQYNNSSLKKVFCDKDIFKTIDSVIYQQDEPFLSASVLAQNELFKGAAKENLRVVLDGQGADEILGGYHNFWGMLLLKFLLQFRIIELFKLCITLKKVQGLQLKRQLRLALTAILSVTRLIEIRSLFSLPRLYFRFFRWRSGLRLPYLISKFAKQMSFEFVFKNRARLHYADRNSYAQGIESRFIYFDYRLVNFSYSQTAGWALKKGLSKQPLQQAFQHILPSIVAQRIEKIGFSTPERFWLELNQKEIISEISNMLALFNLHFEVDQFNRLVKRGNHSIVFRLYCFARWLKVFNVRVT